MRVETKFLRLYRAVELGEEILDLNGLRRVIEDRFRRSH
jgi:hypothetical protein